jgi:hypothetical protein
MTFAQPVQTLVGGQRSVWMIVWLLCLTPLPPGAISGQEDGQKDASQRTEGDRPPDQDWKRRDLHRNRQRWESLPEADRRQIRRLFRHLKEMEPDRRRDLFKRLRGMEPEERREFIERFHQRRLERDATHVLRERKWHKLPDHLREEIRKLPPEERERQIQSYIDRKRAQIDRRRHELIQKLPPELQERVLNLAPQEQRIFLRRYRARQLFVEVFQEPSERQAFLSVPPHMLHRLLQRDASESEPPDVVSEDSWKRWLALKPHERARIIRHIQQLKEKNEGPREEGHGRKGRRERKESPRKTPGFKNRSPTDSFRSGG